VAKAIEFKDRFQNMGAQLVRSVASKTNDVAGDGTTTATVLARAIYSEGCKSVAAGLNPMELRKGMQQAVEHIIGHLKGQSINITSSEEIAQVRARVRERERERERRQSTGCCGCSELRVHHPFHCGSSVASLELPAPDPSIACACLPISRFCCCHARLWRPRRCSFTGAARGHWHHVRAASKAGYSEFQPGLCVSAAAQGIGAP
jgi:hypothetical protein